MEDDMVFDGLQLLNDLLLQKGRLEIELAASQNQCQSLECQRDELRSALEAVEWAESREYGGGDVKCPWCLQPIEAGHKSDCQRQAALANVKGDSE